MIKVLFLFLHQTCGQWIAKQNGCKNTESCMSVESLARRLTICPREASRESHFRKKRRVSLLANEVFGPDVSQQPENRYNSTVTIVEDSLTPSLPKSSKITAQQRVDEFPGNCQSFFIQSGVHIL